MLRPAGRAGGHFSDTFRIGQGGLIVDHRSARQFVVQPRSNPAAGVTLGQCGCYREREEAGPTRRASRMRATSSCLAVMFAFATLGQAAVGPAHAGLGPQAGVPTRVATTGRAGFGPHRGVATGAGTLGGSVPSVLGAGTLGGVENQLGSVISRGAAYRRHGGRNGGVGGGGFSSSAPYWVGDAGTLDRGPPGIWARPDGSAPQTTIGIPPSPVSPPAMYVIDSARRGLPLHGGGAGRPSRNAARATHSPAKTGEIDGRGRPGPLILVLSTTR